MLVVDASALVDLILEKPPNERLRERLSAADELHSPQLLDIEVLSVVRRLCASGALTGDAGDSAVRLLCLLPISRYPHEPLRARVWVLRHTVTAYDAAYVALAELLGLPLVTSDGRLCRSHGHSAVIESYGR